MAIHSSSGERRVSRRFFLSAMKAMEFHRMSPCNELHSQISSAHAAAHAARSSMAATGCTRALHWKHGVSSSSIDQQGRLGLAAPCAPRLLGLELPSLDIHLLPAHRNRHILNRSASQTPSTRHTHDFAELISKFPPFSVGTVSRAPLS